MQVEDLNPIKYINNLLRFAVGTTEFEVITQNRQAKPKYEVTTIIACRSNVYQVNFALSSKQNEKKKN